MDWIECNRIFCVDHGPTAYEKVVSLNTETGEARLAPNPNLQPISIIPMDTWVTVDLSTLIPKGTKAVMMQGQLIISHRTDESQTADLLVYCRKSNDPDWSKFNFIHFGQAATFVQSESVREDLFTICPLSDGGCFDFKWHAENVNAGLPPPHLPTRYAVTLFLVACFAMV